MADQTSRRSPEEPNPSFVAGMAANSEPGSDAVARLQADVTKLCTLLNVPDDLDCLSIMAKALRQGLTRVAAVKTPANYYNLNLEERPALLGGLCPGKHCLAKSIVMENRRAPLDARGPAYSRYYILVFQYTRHLSTTKWHNVSRALARDGGLAGAKGDFTWGLASEAEASAITGAPHNGMGPVGLGEAAEGIPVVLDSNIPKECSWLLMGGLHPLVKLRVHVPEYLSKLGPIVADITDAGQDQ